MKHSGSKKGLQVAVSIALALLGAARSWAARPAVDQVVDRMQQYYVKAKDLRGKFKQVYIDVLYNRRRTSYGELFVKKPGMMRWNYTKPERKSFIADGKELWVWEPKDKQAFRNPLNTDTLSSGLTFLLGTGKLKDEFSVSYAQDKEDQLGAPGALVLRLEPKKPTAQYRYLLVAVAPGDYSVTESMVVSRHSRNHFLFSELKTNTKLGTRVFRFKPPADARIIDGSKLKR
jgi:outer membrane lipoprotein carrier protein